jgi:hypothetical protein
MYLTLDWFLLSTWEMMVSNLIFYSYKFYIFITSLVFQYWLCMAFWTRIQVMKWEMGNVYFFWIWWRLQDVLKFRLIILNFDLPQFFFGFKVWIIFCPSILILTHQKILFVKDWNWTNTSNDRDTKYCQKTGRHNFARQSTCQILPALSQWTGLGVPMGCEVRSAAVLQKRNKRKEKTFQTICQ